MNRKPTTYSRRVSIVPTRGVRSHTSKLWGSFFALLLIAPIAALAQTGVKGEDLYLLTGTPTDWRQVGYPVSLYRIDSGHKLKLVRQIVPGNVATDPEQLGPFAVRDDMGDKIYVAYPHPNPTTVSVIHKERPTMKDDVDFNPEHLTVLTTDFGVAAGDGRQSYFLCTLLREIPNYTGPHPGGVSSSLVSVSGDAPAEGPRIRQNDWTMFSSFRYQGAPGGPLPGLDTLGYIRDGHVRMRAEAGPPPYTMKLDLDSAPPFPIEGDPGDTVFLAFASARYFAFFPMVRLHQTPPVGVAHSPVFVHDRKLNTWKKISFPSAISSPQTMVGSWPGRAIADTRRIFGAWLSTRVEIWQPQGEVRNPGAGNERDWDSPLLPNVHELYQFPEWLHRSVPGTLLLDNLEDGRRITIETGQEDSEVLTVRGDGSVLYRVNDSIFSAQIEGEKLTKPTLVVKDEDVPEVHWVFWSAAASH